jgi:pseudouridine kinase
VTVFGAVAMDVRLSARAPLVAGSSNPVMARETPGGVGRNLAMGLARLGARVRLASAVGDDLTGAVLLADLVAGGVDTGHVGRSREHATARYWAVLEPAGELAMGLADMAVLDALRPADLLPAAAASADAWLIDTNLPEPCLAWLLAREERPHIVAVDTVSVAKAPRLRAHLDRVDLLFTNEAEATALVGVDDAERLQAAGASTVVIGRGAAGLDIATAAGLSRLPALRVQALDVTGAGDALAAASLYALLAGLDLGLAARIGRLAATALLIGKPLSGMADLQEMAFAVDNELHAQLARLQP